MEEGEVYARIPLDRKGVRIINLGSRACSKLEEELDEGRFSLGIWEKGILMEEDMSIATISSSESGQGPRLYVRYALPKK